MDASDTRRGQPGGARPRSRRCTATPDWPGDPDAFGAGRRRSCSATCCCPGPTRCSPSASAAAADRAPGAGRSSTRCASWSWPGSTSTCWPRPAAPSRPTTRCGSIEFKTSKYTVERPLHLGAAAAGAPPELLAALSAYGLPLGEAFQLRDDVLGCLRRPARDRQAGRRRPARGQAHAAGRAGLQAADAARPSVLRSAARRPRSRRRAASRAARSPGRDRRARRGRAAHHRASRAGTRALTASDR